MAEVIQKDWIERRIHFLRGMKVMFSADLAELYGVEPRSLIQAIKRNSERFPSDFMFQLNSSQAIQVNIEIMRVFVQLRKCMTSHKELADKLDKIELKYDNQFRVVFDAIREIITPPRTHRSKIGFHSEE
jgi:hypothetical protein